jgi:uncharacterized membrane protein
MSILNDIPELVSANVISTETAKKIRDYYQNKGGQSQNKLLIVFGVLGSILTGLGIILIIAHNWDDLSRSSKTVFAFLPLIIGQGLCIFILFKKSTIVAWRESGTIFLFFAVAASISLVSQIYNIPGDLSAFLITWMVLCLPLIYLMNSSVSSLLYFEGITWYVCVKCYSTYPRSEDYLYWFLFMLALPHYYLLYKRNPGSNFMTFHNWIVPISLTIALGSVAEKTQELIYIGYISLFGLFYLIGNSSFFKEQKLPANLYRNLGSVGTIALLLSLSFDWFWTRLRARNFQFNDLYSPEFIAAFIITLAAAGLLYRQKRNKPLEINPTEPAFIFFIIIFLIGLSSPLSVVLVNLLVFTIGVLTIRKGAKDDHLGILNYGLLIITALVICRFFDTDLSFVARGILFISVGMGFFLANLWMNKKRKENA